MNNEDSSLKNTAEPGKNWLRELPPEVMQMVVKNLVTPDANETARNINNFRRTDKFANEFVENTSVLARFSERIGRLGAIARNIYDRAIPQGPLQGNFGESDSIIHRRVATATQLLGFRSPVESAKLVDKVSSLSDEDGLRSLASIPLVGSKKIDRKDIKMLVNQAIRTSNSDRTGHDTRNPNNADAKKFTAHLAIQEANAYGNLTDKQRAKLRPGVLDEQPPAAWSAHMQNEKAAQNETREELSDHLSTLPKNKQIDKRIRLVEDALAEESARMGQQNENGEDEALDLDQVFGDQEMLAKLTRETYEDSYKDLVTGEFQRSPYIERPNVSYDERTRGSQERGS